MLDDAFKLTLDLIFPPLPSTAHSEIIRKSAEGMRLRSINDREDNKISHKIK